MVLRMSSGHSNCQYKVAGYGHSKRCSTDGRRFAIRLWEESAGHHVGYAACYGCARWTVRNTKAENDKSPYIFEEYSPRRSGVSCGPMRHAVGRRGRQH
jgi:hypothetical protein